MARFYRGYYNFAVDRRPDAHEFWTGMYSEQALLDMEGIELVIKDIPTDRQFNSLRRMGEIKAAETRAAMTKVAGEGGSPKIRSPTIFAGMLLGLSRTVNQRDTEGAYWTQMMKTSLLCCRWTRGRRHGRRR